MMIGIIMTIIDDAHTSGQSIRRLPFITGMTWGASFFPEELMRTAAKKKGRADENCSEKEVIPYPNKLEGC